MKLEEIQIRDFRNYERLDIRLPSRLVFLTGRNAAGKTNLLEAISLLVYGKSFRGAADRDLMRQKGSNSYFVSGTYSRSGYRFTLEQGCQLEGSRLKKRIKKNDRVLSGRAELIGNLIGVVFSPSDIMILEGGSQERRRFLDSLLSRQDRDYLTTLVRYNRILRQRNSILKKIRERKAGRDELAPWNDSLITHGNLLTEKRLRFVEEFGGIFQESLLHISRRHDPVHFELQLSHPSEKEGLKESLMAGLYRDMSSGYTTTGPHRHTLNFLYEDRDITTTGSQGQKRSVVLALRIAEFHFLKQSLGVSPLLLIDDVIRELDADRRGAFVEILHRSGQAIFTTPDLDGLENLIAGFEDEVCVYHIPGNGTAERVS